MPKIGRNYFAIIAEAHVPATTNGKVDLSPSFIVEKTELKSAINITPVAGTPGFLTITLAGTYAVGDFIRVTITSNLTSRQAWRKSYTHTVLAGAATVTAIAAAIAAQIAADVPEFDSPYSASTSAAGVITVTQKGDDKKGLVGYVHTDSALGTIVNVPTTTVISEGQPSDLVDRGIDVEDINLAAYDTVRIIFHGEAPIPFIDSAGATSKEIYWFGTAGNGAGLATLINTP